MPAKRLPWFKLWIGSTAHGKVRQLDDGAFRTWVELLDVAAQQPRRGRFESRKEALAICRRPAKHLSQLITAGLIDERADGLWMHDWEEWQRWRPEDANDSPTPPDHPPNGRVNDSRTTTEHQVNVNSLRVRAAAPASGEERREKREVDKDPLPPAGEAPRLRVVPEAAPKPVPKPTPVGTLLDKIKALDPAIEVYGDQGFTGRKLKENPDADLDLIAEAYVSFRHGEWPGSKMLRESGSLAWVIGDLGGYVGWRKQYRGAKRLPPDRTGVAN